MKPFYIFIFAIGISGCTGSSKQKITDSLCFDNKIQEKIIKVSLTNEKKLKKLDSQFVQVEGIFHFDFEDAAIYPIGSEDSRKAIWINNFAMPKPLPDSLIRKFRNKHVLIIGKLDMNDKGHLGSYMAALNGVSCIERIE